MKNINGVVTGQMKLRDLNQSTTEWVYLEILLQCLLWTQSSAVYKLGCLHLHFHVSYLLWEDRIELAAMRQVSIPGTLLFRDVWLLVLMMFGAVD